MFRTPLGLETLAKTCQFILSGITRTTKSKQPFEKHLVAYLQHHHWTSTPPIPPSPNHNHKMSFLLPGLRRGLLLSTPLILSTPLLVHHHLHRRQAIIRCDGPDPLTKITNDLTRNYASEAQTPLITQSGAANPRAVRQVSMGSILGVIGGLGISVFSKPLAVLIGLGIVILQVSFEDFFFWGKRFEVGWMGRRAWT